MARGEKGKTKLNLDIMNNVIIKWQPLVQTSQNVFL